MSIYHHTVVILGMKNTRANFLPLMSELIRYLEEFSSELRILFSEHYNKKEMMLVNSYTW